MARCSQCGNDYDKSFEILIGGETHIFDSFECAIEKLAPRCAHCMAHCGIEVPRAVTVAPDHSAACLLAETRELVDA